MTRPDSGRPGDAAGQEKSAAEAVVEIDDSGRVTAISPAAEDLLGAAVHAGDAVGACLGDPEGAPLGGDFLEAVLNLTALAPLRRAGVPLYLQDGGDGPRPVRVTVEPASGNGGTHRLRIRSDPAASASGAAADPAADELAGILEVTPDFLAALDLEGRIRFLNRGARDLLGGSAEAAGPGHLLTDFQPETAARRFLEEALPAALEGGSWHGESALRSAHGAEIPVELTLVARSEGGRTRSLFTIIRDISDRKREEERLRDSEEKYRRILEAAQEGFWIVHDQLQGEERPQLRFKVPVSRGSRIVLLDLPEVRYFQADGHYTQVFTGDGSFLCNLSVSDLERRLDATQFVRIHRSYIINLQYIDVLERVDEQWCVTIGGNGERLPVSRRNVEKVKVMLGVS
ncbi:MAG TPA: LytTR family transcriptional regulator DNA-binding domain-containing protein [Gammaproteobacteria bacterium]|nr:LytTR family transcriptional regulator DNA-binding domain-containing protein [Gammaproteobacteria bacterium]